MARFTPRDPLHSAARRFFADQKSGLIISPISLVEINAVLSRGYVAIEAPGFIGKNGEVRKVRALTEYFIRMLGLRIESLPLVARLSIAGAAVSIPLEYSEALKRAAEVRLKTLDLLHLAYAGLINTLRVRIDNFVTGDSEITDRGRTIGQRFGFNVVHPKDVTT